MSVFTLQQIGSQETVFPEGTAIGDAVRELAPKAGFWERLQKLWSDASSNCLEAAFHGSNMVDSVFAEMSLLEELKFTLRLVLCLAGEIINHIFILVTSN